MTEGKPMFLPGDRVKVAPWVEKGKLLQRWHTIRGAGTVIASFHECRGRSNRCAWWARVEWDYSDPNGELARRRYTVHRQTIRLQAHLVPEGWERALRKEDV